MKGSCWSSDSKILGVYKEMPIQRMTTGISKDRQFLYDDSCGIHGSNGTYVENVNPFWCINFRVYKIAPDIDEVKVFSADIHEYITQILMPKEEWKLINKSRLNIINEKVKGIKLKVITYDVDEAPAYRTYIPWGYSNWGDFLRTLF